MYSWKPWHDSRSRLVLYGGAALALGALTGLILLGACIRERAWIAISSNPRLRLWDPSFDFWEWGVRWLLQYLFPASVWMALIFGFTSVGREYGSGAMAFVLTRPQSRWKIVWGEWALAVSEICMILSLLIIGAIPFLYFFSGPYFGFSGLILPGILAAAACLYGVAQFLTILTGSSGRGLSATIAVVLFFYFLPGALNDWWHISGPLRVLDLSLSVFELGWQEPPLSLPSLYIAMLWFLVALIFPFLSQWLIERREV